VFFACLSFSATDAAFAIVRALAAGVGINVNAKGAVVGKITGVAMTGAPIFGASILSLVDFLLLNISSILSSS
jgi:hypothetical protein